MHINVRDFLAESVGYSRSYAITGERPHLESIVLTGDVQGEVVIARLEESSLFVKGSAATEIELECHRCLRTFTRPVRVSFQQIFALEPKDDEMPIADDEIDLAPLLEQEIILSLPIKILDRKDCPGIPLKPSPDDQIAPPDTSIKGRARIIKEER